MIRRKIVHENTNEKGSVIHDLPDDLDEPGGDFGFHRGNLEGA